MEQQVVKYLLHILMYLQSAQKAFIESESCERIRSALQNKTQTSRTNDFSTRRLSVL